MLFEQANRESGSMIFQAHNSGYQLEQLLEQYAKKKRIGIMHRGKMIDFHGLQVREVEENMSFILGYSKRKNKRCRVTIITGSGNHSYSYYCFINV